MGKSQRKSNNKSSGLRKDKKISREQKPNNKLQGQKSQNKKQHGGSKLQFNKMSKQKRSFIKNNKAQQDVNPQQSGIQNSYGIVDKQKLLSLSSAKQLQIIKQLHQKILASPQQNIKHLQPLFLLAKVSNLRVVSVSLRLLADLFINIAPLDSIDIKRLDDRTEGRVTKEQFKIIRFEKVLVEQYQRYIRMIKQLKAKLKAQDFGKDQQMFIQFRKCILQCALKCFNSLWNFNFSRQLCDLLINFIKFKQCRDSFQNLLSDKNIATVSIKVKIINSIAQLIKRKQDNELPDDLIKVLNSTFIDSRYLQKDRDAITFKQKKIKKKIYKQEAFDKKQQKQKQKQGGGDKLQQKRQKKKQKMQIKMKVKQQINKQFAQGQAIISNKLIVKNNSSILQQLFYIYFKVLVQKVNSKFLKDVLAGILNFAHLINIDLISEMIQHLNEAAIMFRQVWSKNPSIQNLEIRLIIVFTMESILNGPLSVYNMDDISVTANFYKILRDMNQNQQKTQLNRQSFRLLCITLDQVFIKRRQLSQQIVGSFLREVSTLLGRKYLPKIFLLQFIRLVSSKYSKVSRMFQQDNQGYGINAYNQACQDPQSTNAINTQILSKINVLKKNDKNSKTYEADIHQYITRLNRQNFLRIQGTQTLQNILKSDLDVGF